MPTRFIHTADWQIGKPYGAIPDPEMRTRARDARIQAIRAIGRAASDQRVDFVVVAGDLFDSQTVSTKTLVAACDALGSIPVPVVVIPGNHDFGAPEGIWHDPFLTRHLAEMAPNVRVVLDQVPIELTSATVFSCPSLRRSESLDTTAWLRAGDALQAALADVPRIILAHGSTQDFGSAAADGDEEEAIVPNRLDVSRLPEADYDYIALGDWHGVRQVTPKAWYSGTPEPDRFPKGADYRSGVVLLVEAERRSMSVVREIPTGTMTWSVLDHALSGTGREAVAALEALMQERLDTGVHTHLMRLTVEGALGFDAHRLLDEWCESMNAKLVRFDLVNRVRLSPTESELADLAGRDSDPLIARVSRRLLSLKNDPSQPDPGVVESALLALYLAATDETPRGDR